MAALKTAKHIIANAWRFTVTYRDRLFWFGVIPSFFSILATALYVSYQFEAFREFFYSSTGHKNMVLSYAIDVLIYLKSSPGLLFFTLILAFLFFLAWFFIPMLSRGAITHLMLANLKGKNMRRGTTAAFLHFFPLFQMATFKRSMQPVTFYGWLSFLWRNLGSGAAGFIWPVLLFFGTIGLILLFLTAFTTQIIMDRDAEFMDSFRSSFRLVTGNMRNTFFLFILILFIELRVLINVIIIFFIPLATATITGFFARDILRETGLILSLVVGALLVCAAAYLTGILFLFSEAIWTMAFWEFQKDED